VEGADRAPASGRAGLRPATRLSEREAARFWRRPGSAQSTLPLNLTPTGREGERGPFSLSEGGGLGWRVPHDVLRGLDQGSGRLSGGGSAAFAEEQRRNSRAGLPATLPLNPPPAMREGEGSLPPPSPREEGRCGGCPGLSFDARPKSGATPRLGGSGSTARTVGRNRTERATTALPVESLSASSTGDKGRQGFDRAGCSRQPVHPPSATGASAIVPRRPFSAGAGGRATGPSRLVRLGARFRLRGPPRIGAQARRC